MSGGHFDRPNGLTMGEPEKADSPANYLPSERAGHGGPALDLQTMPDGIAQKGEP